MFLFVLDLLLFILAPFFFLFQEESRANVVINQKMMKVIVSGIPQSVRLGVAMIEDVITFGRSAEHAGGMGGHPPNFLDFPGAVAFGGKSMCNVFAIQNAPFLSLWQFATALSYAGNGVLNKRTWIFLTLRSTRYITNPGITNAGIYIYIFWYRAIFSATREGLEASKNEK